MKLSYTILYVENVQESVDFYIKAFGLKGKFIHESGDYAEMETGETTLAFCAHGLAVNIISEGYTKASVKEKALGSQITFDPESVKDAFERAVASGAKIVSKPEVKPWNFEVAIVRDNNGHIIEFAKNLN